MRKAKEKAREKLDLWCGKRNTPKSTKSDTKALTTALSTTEPEHSGDNIRNCSVYVKRLSADEISDAINTVKNPTKVVEKATEEDHAEENANIYDYTFDSDAIPLNAGNQNDLNELFKKMEKENKITVKKYRPKNVKKQPQKKVVEKKTAPRKRRNIEKSSVEEPVQKVPNLKMTEHVNTRLRLRNIDMTNHHSTPKSPKSDTAVGASAGQSIERRRPIEFSFADMTSPIMNSTRKKVHPTSLPKQRLNMSPIDESDGQGNDFGDNMVFDDHDDYIGDNVVEHVPNVDLTLDKENARKKFQNNSRATMQSSANDKSVFSISNSSFEVFSPTKRRVYGRSPLKNITSDVQNTNYENTFDLIKPISTISQSTSTTSPLRITSSNDTLRLRSNMMTPSNIKPIGTNVSNIEVIDPSQLVKDCFGFDFCDDDEVAIVDQNSSEKADASSCTIIGKNALKESRQNLKRFLKQSNQPATKTTRTANMKVRINNNNNSKCNQNKNDAMPIKKPQGIFDAGSSSKQRDIRSAFSTKSSAESEEVQCTSSPILFEEVQVVQDRRKSYSRPVKPSRKRRISADSDVDDESEDECVEENKTKAKRRKKVAEPNAKEIEELEKFAKEFNSMCEEVDQYELVKEPVDTATLN